MTAAASPCAFCVHPRCISLRWWLLRHAHHGTGPIRKTVSSLDIDHHGRARMDPAGRLLRRDVTFYRCECEAVRRVSVKPT